MKKLFVVALILIGMIGWGQEAKLDYWYQLTTSGNDTINFVVYSYDSANNLQQVYYRHHWKIPRWITFSNDTLIHDSNWLGTKSYFYSDDDTVMWINNSQGYIDTLYLRINENNEVIELESNHYNWTWKDGNCMEEIRWGEDTNWYREYYSGYINPWYEENKYLRQQPQSQTYSGSYNLLSNQYDLYTNGFEWEFDVIESIGPYPTIIDYYAENTLLGTYYFEYQFVIFDIPELPEEPVTVLSVDYFDMLGREIPKPKRGFYIERKTTNKGIISTRYYIK